MAKFTENSRRLPIALANFAPSLRLPKKLRLNPLGIVRTGPHLVQPVWPLSLGWYPLPIEHARRGTSLTLWSCT